MRNNSHWLLSSVAGVASNAFMNLPPKGTQVDMIAMYVSMSGSPDLMPSISPGLVVHDSELKLCGDLIDVHKAE